MPGPSTTPPFYRTLSRPPGPERPPYRALPTRTGAALEIGGFTKGAQRSQAEVASIRRRRMGSEWKSS